jgi:hypothetical protein
MGGEADGTGFRNLRVERLIELARSVFGDII